MTLTDLLTDTYDRTGHASSPGSTVSARITRFLNETQQEILSEPGMQGLLYGSLTIASVADLARYGLPAATARIVKILDTTNRRPLELRTLDWYRTIDADPSTNTGTPQFYIPLGQQAVKRVPAVTGTGLWAASTSAADTGAGFKVAIEGVRVGGYPNTIADTNLNGVTRAALGSLTDYIDVTQFALTAACAGDVSLYDAASSGNVLATIPIGLTTSRYQGFALYPTPSAALTYTVDVEHDAFSLSAALDEPLLPVKFHHLLSMGARRKEYEKADDDRWIKADAEYQRELLKLKYHVFGSPDQVVIPGRTPSGDGGSNLGAWTPAGRW